MINYEADSTVYEQVAGLIRARIEAGEWAARQRLPSVTHLEHEYGIARQTVIKALKLLADWGLVYTVRNRGSFVRVGADQFTVVIAEPGMRIIPRPSTDTERREMDLAEGAWVVTVERAGGEVEVLPADKVEIRGAEV